MITTYYATGAPMTGTSGFTNYSGRATPEALAALHDRMKRELGEHVIVDGDDDWMVPSMYRPPSFFEDFAKDAGREYRYPLAYYHSRISGITRSGIVVTPDDFDAMTEWYAQKYGQRIDANPRLTLTFHSNSTEA